MSGRSEELANKRRALQARIAQQRGELGAASYTLEHHLGLVDHGVALIRRIASPPVLIAAGVAIIFLARPARLIRWAGNVLIFAAAYKRLGRDE
jgi:hypothetical protein